MVKFEQKEFFAPLAILNAASMGVGAVSGVKGMMDSSAQTELQEKQLQQQKVDSYRQQKAQQDQIAATNNFSPTSIFIRLILSKSFVIKTPQPAPVSSRRPFPIYIPIGFWGFWEFWFFWGS